MSSPASPGNRCPACRRPADYCYCSRITVVNNQIPVFILQDKRESRHAIGTARIAALSLTHAEIAEIDLDRPQNHKDMLASAFSRPLVSPLLLYPGGQEPRIAVTGFDNTPPQLLVIDADWKRSRRMLHVFPELAALPRISLSNLPVSRYRIRKEPAPNAVSTLEAIVATLQHLEPERDFTPLLATMDWVIDQQIARMGQGVYEANYIKSR